MNVVVAKRIIREFNETNYPNRVKVQIVHEAESFLRDFSNNNHKPKLPHKLSENNKPAVIAQRVFLKDFKREGDKPIKIKTNNRELIMDKMCDYISLKFMLKQDIKSRCRDEEVRLPRQIAHYFAYELGIDTYKGIARFFNMNHSTVMHSWNVIHNMSKYDKAGKVLMDEIEIEIKKIIDENI